MEAHYDAGHCVSGSFLGIVQAYGTSLGEPQEVIGMSQAFLSTVWCGVTLYGITTVFRYRLKTAREVSVVAVSREHSMRLACTSLLGILIGLALFWYSPRVTIELSGLTCCFVGAARLTQKYW
jgi:heme/copper-type cytochrome/quinol oxidase subunit 2